MKTKDLLTIAAVSAGLAFGVTAQAKEREHEEQTISSSDVPAAVQQAAQAEAKGGTHCPLGERGRQLSSRHRKERQTKWRRNGRYRQGAEQT